MEKVVNENEALIARIRKLLTKVDFRIDLLPPYVFTVHEGHGGVLLRAQYMDADIYSGRLEMQYTRKWPISPAATDSEIVQTAFKCVMTSFEHRVREAFMYKGARIFGPHFNVDDLVKLCHDGREDAGGRK